MIFLFAGVLNLGWNLQNAPHALYLAYRNPSFSFPVFAKKKKSGEEPWVHTPLVQSAGTVRAAFRQYMISSVLHGPCRSATSRIVTSSIGCPVNFILFLLGENYFLYPYLHRTSPKRRKTISKLRKSLSILM